MMESPARIASHFCAQVLNGRQSDEFPGLIKYFEDGGSVCALARKGAAGLVSEFGLDDEDARALALRLNGLATWVLRRFIEEQLTRREPLPEHLRQGLLALVDGPTYEKVFRPNFSQKCPIDAIEAIHSPVAYAVWLKHWSEYRLRPSNPGEAFALKTRRLDLDELPINPVTTYGVVSSVEVVSKVLETSIKDSLGEIGNLDEKLSQRRYPNGLPYHHPWVTMDELTRDLGTSVGGVVQLCDPTFPYFLRALPWGETADHALTQSARLSPSQRLIMTEPLHYPDTDDFYFRDNFGLRVDSIEPQNLNQTFFFNQRTKLTQPRLEALLSVELFAPTVSDHVLLSDQQITPGHSGSVFVNNGLAESSMGIDYGGSEEANRITNLFFSDPIVYRFDKVDRLNRKIRLDNALQLPSHETDALLSAIIGAELGLTETSEDDPPTYWMTDNTLRALGLFQMLREHYQCSAEEFAACMGPVSIFGRGTESSQFDRVFNKDTLAIPALVLDGTEFETVPVNEADALTVVHICSGLNIDLATYFNLAPLILEALSLDKLKRSLAVVSSFYRMARLPQILGVAPNLAVEILHLLGDRSGSAALAGRPYINESRAELPDTLVQIQRLEGWVRWCADSGLDVAWTVEHVRPIAMPAQPSEAQLQLFAQIRSKLAPALFTEAALRMAGTPELTNSRQWTNQLLELADQDGLVIHRAESPEQPYDSYAREVVERVVRQVIGQPDPQTVERIMGVLLSSRASQHGVVQESLAVYGELAPALALPVLGWSGGTVYELLLHVVGRTPLQNASGSRPLDEAPGDPLLGMLGGFIRRSEVVTALKLSVEFLTLYLSIGDGVGGLPGTQAFTPSALYYLTVYDRAVVLSQKPESQLLDYLQRVNGLPDGLSGDGLTLVQEQAAKLLAELFDWSAEEVRVCAARANASQGYIRTLEHLDLFTRLRRFSLLSKLDAPTTLKMGTLAPDSPFDRYEAVAQQVATLLADPGSTSPLYGIESMANQVMIDCVIGTTELVAKSGATTPLSVTITRAGAALKNVRVHWAANLCTVDPAISSTNENGVATTTVTAGTTMGRDVISYRLDVREPQPAEVITLGNDPTDLSFYPLQNEITVTEEKVGVDVTLRAELIDRYENPAAHEPVTWVIDPLMMEFHTSTNAEGITEVTFTSQEALITSQPVVRKGSLALRFQPIEFIQ